MHNLSGGKSPAALLSGGLEESPRQLVPVRRDLPFRIKHREQFREWLGEEIQKCKAQESGQLAPDFDQSTSSSNQPQIPPQGANISYGSTGGKTSISQRSEKLQTIADALLGQKLEKLEDAISRFHELLPVSTDKKQLLREFRVLAIGKSCWELVLPYFWATGQYEKKTVVPIPELIFFHNPRTKETSASLSGTRIEGDDLPIANFMINNPMIVCLRDEMIKFICEVSFPRVDPFEFLRKNECEPEQQMLYHFKEEGQRKKEFYAKQFQNYLLLDPRNLNLKQPAQNTFYEFLESNFYIGKGAPDRPFKHMQELISAGSDTAQHPRSNTLMNQFGESFKKGRIQEIWDAKRGVIVLSFFQHVLEQEGYYREHCIILARHDYGRDRWLPGIEWADIPLGPLSLTNKDDGNTEWLNKQKVFDFLKFPIEFRQEMGTRMLFYAYGQFLNARLEEQFDCNFMTISSKPGSIKSSSSKSSQVSKPSTSSKIQKFQRVRRTQSDPKRDADGSRELKQPKLDTFWSSSRK